MISEFFKAPLAAKYACESGCKRLRSSLLQVFLQNTCFVPCRRLAKEDEMVSNFNSFSVSTIVGCWEAYGKEYGRLSLASLSAYWTGPNILLFRIVTNVTRSVSEFAISLYCVWIIWIPVSVFHLRYGTKCVLFSWKVSKFSVTVVCSMKHWQYCQNLVHLANAYL